MDERQNDNNILAGVVALTIIVVALIFVTRSARTEEASSAAPAPTASVGSAGSELSFTEKERIATTTARAASTTAAKPAPKSVLAPAQKKEISMSASAAPAVEQNPPKAPAQESEPQAVRIQDPYPFPPKDFGTVNEETRLALINVLCSTTRGGALRPISGSGVIIDPRGIILTNAHVAQYVLLSADPRLDLSCAIRSGSPAAAKWRAEVLYIPPVWIEEHASDIVSSRPTGTGDHDYALLRVTGALDGSLPSPLPFLPIDARETIGFVSDAVLVAGYPAEFIGGIATQSNLYPVTTVTTIKNLLTFGIDTVDVVSVGGVIEAQSGSSGGPVVNAWGRLIGILSTTSEGATTGERDLRAITLSYIDRDITRESGSSLAEILLGDMALQAAFFKQNIAPNLVEALMAYIARR